MSPPGYSIDPDYGTIGRRASIERRRGGKPVSEQAPVLQLEQLIDGVALGLEGYNNAINVLLLCVPFGILSGLLKWRDDATFVLNFLGMIPLAMILGKSTEDIAEHTNQTIGALVNVTFGNAVELIISIAAIRAGRPDLVRNTLVGSILSNLLLVMGSAFIAGGCVFKEQQVLPAVAEANSDMLSFAVFGLCIPTLFNMAVVNSSAKVGLEERLSFVTAFCLLIMYACYLTFSLHTHAEFYEESSYENGDFSSRDLEETSRLLDGPSDQQPTQRQQQTEPVASMPIAIAILCTTVLAVALCSELLIDALEGFSHKAGLSQAFIAVILLPVIGNAVEHLSAIFVAYRGKIDLAIGIACGSSVQIALFAAPVLVLCSWLVPGRKLTLDFDLFGTASIAFSVFVVNATLRDTKTNWLEGAVLVMCYVIVSAAFFLMP